jgi:hypothetical protein
MLFKFIPVDVRKLRFLIVGEPRAQMRDGEQVVDLETKIPMFNIDMTIIGENRAETMQVGVPENGFPKGMGIGTMVIPDDLLGIRWENDKTNGIMLRARSVKVDGGQAGMKATAGS